MNTITRQRLFVDNDLHLNASLTLDRDQSHYLINVLRQGIGDQVLVFNGRDGEFRAEISTASKRSVDLLLVEQTQDQGQDHTPDLMLAFAPVKKARIDFIAEKATELGAGIIQPMITDYTAMSRVNTGRLKANAVEASEQTGRLTVPKIEEPISFRQLLEAWPAGRHIIFCDEAVAGENDLAMVNRIQGLEGPVAIFIGPEGGFSPAERDRLNARPESVSVSLGPNILRADTAMVAALSIWQAVAGEWRNKHGN